MILISQYEDILSFNNNQNDFTYKPVNSSVTYKYNLYLLDKDNEEEYLLGQYNHYADANLAERVIRYCEETGDATIKVPSAKEIADLSSEIDYITILNDDISRDVRQEAVKLSYQDI